MGRATIIWDNMREVQNVESQTLQMAKQNGVIANITDIDLTNPENPINRPHLVTSETSGAPNDLSVGVLEFFYSNADKAILLITGLSKTNNAMIWVSVATISDSNETLIGTWNHVIADVFKGASATSAGNAGMVPAPSIGDESSILMGDGSWKKPIDKYATGVASVGESVVLTYNTGETETLTQNANGTYTVIGKNADGDVVRTYVTSVDENGDITVTAS